MLQFSELKDFLTYAEDLKAEIVRSKTKIVPFRFFCDFPFDDKKDRDILLVGKAPPALLSEVKKVAGPIKLEGDCRLEKKEFSLKVDNGQVNVERVQKLLKSAKIMFAAKFVEEFEGGAQASEKDLDMKAAKQRVASIQQRIESVLDHVVDKELLLLVFASLREVMKRIKDGDATAYELLDEAEKTLIPVERDAQIARKAAGQAPVPDAKRGNSQEETQAELKAIAQAAAVSKKAEEMGQTALNTILKARDIAIKWQTLEMDKMLADKDQFNQLQDKFNADVKKIEESIVAAKKELKLAQVANDQFGRGISSDSMGTNEKKRKTAEFWKTHQQRIVKGEQAIEKMENFLRKLRNDFSQARARVAAGGNHGTARHGTHTGLEQQALRAATGGRTPDQADNEWGDSRDKPQPEPSIKAASSPEKVRWTMGGKDVELECVDLPGGKRDVKNMEEFFEKFNEIAEGLEKRKANTSTSSNFLSPELEKEAVDRALRVAKQCVWDEYWDNQKSDWLPIDTFFIHVGPPKVIRSKGWGHSVSRNKDDANKNAPAMKLVQANKILNAFRDGKIDMNQMMKMMNVSLAEDDGGAILQPVATVMIYRAGSGWTNTSQYPSAETPGWDLKGVRVRKRRDGGEGITAPDAMGV